MARRRRRRLTLPPLAAKLKPTQAAPSTSVRKETTDRLKQAVAHYWATKCHAVFFEISLDRRRTRLPVKGCRADVLAVNTRGQIVVVEVKSCTADFRADSKYDNYRPYCNLLYFALPYGMKTPQELLDAPGIGILQEQEDGALRVSKRATRNAVDGKLRKSTVLSLLFRAADYTSIERTAGQWKPSP